MSLGGRPGDEGSRQVKMGPVEVGVGGPRRLTPPRGVEVAYLLLEIGPSGPVGPLCISARGLGVGGRVAGPRVNSGDIVVGSSFPGFKVPTEVVRDRPTGVVQ